jgi:nicotinamide-nucleotide amidase
MKAEIISIGTELLLGTITDTNAAYLAGRLADLGIDCYFVSQVGDNETRIVETLRRAFERSDLVVTTGGLGPTGDDLTREAIATLLGESPYVAPELEARLREFFTRRGLSMPDRNLKQATLIPSAQTLRNPVGTAPGWLVKSSVEGVDRYIVAMPGVPYEMKRMWEQEVETWLRPMCSDVLLSRTLKILGLGESAIDEKVSDLTSGSNPTLAPYAKQDGVHLRITAKSVSAIEAREMIAQLEQQLRERLGDAVYGVDDDTPSGVVMSLLSDAHASIGVLEIGAGAVGAVSAQLASYEGLRIALAARTVHEAAHIFVGQLVEEGLADVGGALLRSTGADIALALKVSQEHAAIGNSVRAEAEIVLVTRADFDRPVRAAGEWITSSGEVPRLVGLLALNMLRRWLLIQGRGARHLNAV